MARLDTVLLTLSLLATIPRVQEDTRLHVLVITWQSAIDEHDH